jgi:hypothetical protein
MMEDIGAQQPQRKPPGKREASPMGRGLYDNKDERLMVVVLMIVNKKKL